MKQLSVLLLVLVGAFSASAQELSVEEQNKATVEHFMQIINQKDWADHLSVIFEPADCNAFKEGHGAFREVFPDYHVQIHMIAARGDTVYTFGTVTGTHTKTWNLFPGIPATGKKLQWDETGIIIMKNGKSVGGFILNDRLGIMNQLGYGCKPEAFQP